jgi:hypothetical protein
MKVLKGTLDEKAKREYLVKVLKGSEKWDILLLPVNMLKHYWLSDKN